MDQDQTKDNDLQKAIDDITNKTNIDPVFSDPIAAPSSIPEGDTGELGDPIGPLSDAFNTEGDGGLEHSAVPESFGTPVGSFASPKFPKVPVAPVPEGPMPGIPQPPFPAPPNLESAPEPSPAVDAEQPVGTSANFNVNQVKEAALRDLVPLLDRLNMTPSQRFDICRNIFEDLRDYSVLEQAYRAATQIPNETKRAEALLYLVESINRM